MKKVNSFVHTSPYRGKMREPIITSDDSDYPAPPIWIVAVFVAICIFGMAFAIGVMVGGMEGVETIHGALDGAVIVP